MENNQQEVLGGLGETLATENTNGEVPLTGDWKIVAGLQIDRPKDFGVVSREDAVALLEQASLSLRRVAGMKEDFREKYDGLSDKFIGLVGKIKNNEISVTEALTQLDGENENSDKIEKL